MSSLVTSATNLKSFIGLSTDASAAVYVYQPLAEKELRALLTSDVYEALVAELPDDVDAKCAARAECLLALRHSLAVLGMRILDNGGLSKMVGHGDYQEELAGPVSIENARKALYAQAMEFIRGLIPDSATLTEDEQALQFEGNGFAVVAVEPHTPFWPEEI